jgi:hypothetical protein
MSASATPPPSLTHFSATELDMLAKTADALSARKRAAAPA